MRLLALEAGGPLLSAALFEDGSCVASAFVRAPQRQTERLAPLVQALLASRGWPVASVNALACGVGPGSFTGLRSSLAFGVGLALGVPGLRLIGVPTLHAWAEAFAPAGIAQVRVCLDGRRGQAYRARLERDGAAWRDLETPALLDRAEALAGPAAPLLGDLAPGPLGAPSPASTVDSAALAEAVGRLALAGDEAPWDPLYLRRAEAEILWDKLHPKA